MKKLISPLLLVSPFVIFAQISYGSASNTQYHQFFRNGLGSAIYVNQISSAANHPILRLSSGTASPNQNVRFTVENNGDVGIGAASPDARLHVATSDIGVQSQYALGIFEAADAQIDLISSSAGAWGSTINLIEGNGASNQDIWSITRQTTNGVGNSSLRFNFGTTNNHTNSNVATFSADGKVGFGTTDPTNGLVHIYRNATTGGMPSVTTANAGLRIQDSGSSLYIDGNTMYTSGNMILGTLSAASFSIGTNNAERMRVLSNGNVGIGTTTTGTHKLAVEGTIGAREIKVESGTWSDFVFEDDYDLKPLKEVEAFITENKHLPEIPSEAEVTENGINLGEMDAKLLQKIEELTLYLIEQNKQIEALQEEVSSLKKGK